MIDSLLFLFNILDEVLMNALFQMLSTMKMSVIYIPDTVSILFSKLNDSIDKKNPCTHLTSVGFKVGIFLHEFASKRFILRFNMMTDLTL